MFSRGFISSVVNNVFLVSFFAVVRCEACFRNASKFLSVRHLRTVQSQCPPVCDGHPWGGGAQHVLSTVIPHRHSKLLVRYTLPALQDSEPASLQSESLCRSHAAPAGRQVESPRCAGPSRTGGYAAHPLNLGTINVKTDDIIIVVAVKPCIFNLGESIQKTFPCAGGTCCQEAGLRLLNIKVSWRGIQHASQRAA